MDREGLLKNLEQRLCDCRILIGSLQRRDNLALTVDVSLSALNSQFGILYKMLQVRGRHAGA